MSMCLQLCFSPTRLFPKGTEQSPPYLRKGVYPFAQSHSIRVSYYDSVGHNCVPNHFTSQTGGGVTRTEA